MRKCNVCRLILIGFGDVFADVNRILALCICRILSVDPEFDQFAVSPQGKLLKMSMAAADKGILPDLPLTPQARTEARVNSFIFLA